MPQISTIIMAYTKKHRLGDLIVQHCELLPLMSRFGIPLGFGDKTIASVCEEYNVDANTFLAVANFMLSGDMTGSANVSVADMTMFLRNSHKYYLDYLLPKIRQKLIAAVEGADKQLADLMLKFYDNYVASVKQHLTFENDIVFTNVDKLLAGQPTDSSFSIESYSRRHEQIDGMLIELKNFIIKYYPSNGKTYEMNTVLYNILNCEADLHTHCEIEDAIYIPAVAKLEKK